MTDYSPTPTRQADAPVDDLFVTRWSPRAFDATEITPAEVLQLLEASRWAPSANNAQPWRFVFAVRGDAAWDGMLACLAPGNRVWAAQASALIAVASVTHKTTPTGEAVLNGSHAFDAGAAWAHLALSAHQQGWATHAMGGFDRDAMAAAIALPDQHALHAVVALGKRGDVALLPAEIQSREQPSPRRPIAELAHAGRFAPAA
jgi:nitroreductase